MDTYGFLKGKRVLVVDDEQDVLEIVKDLLSHCKLDTADSFGSASRFLQKSDYDIVVLDIMGVHGYELLKIANERKFPALMLTAHALSSENLKRSADEGAAYFAPKERIEHLPEYIADVLDAVQTKKSPWRRMFSRLGDFYDKQFNGPHWRESENEFWEKKTRQMV